MISATKLTQTLAIIAASAFLAEATVQRSSSFITSDPTLSVANGGPGNCLYTESWGDNYMTHLSVDTNLNSDFRPLSLTLESGNNSTGAMVITVDSDSGTFNVKVPFDDTDIQSAYAKLCIEETEETNSNSETTGKLVFY